jgi:branched-chain amino acid aminotransferase
MSKEFAENKGYNDALMLDYRGYVAEGTGANIFFVKDKEIHTPIPDCFLNGITRQTVIEMVSMNGFKVIEKYIKPEEVSNYDEAFLTGTAAEVTPIQSIDENLFQTGEDTQTFKFMQEFHDLVRS